MHAETIVLLGFLAVVVVIVIAAALADGAKTRREQVLRLAVQQRGLERGFEVARTKQEMHQAAAQVRRELTAELRHLDKGKS